MDVKKIKHIQIILLFICFLIAFASCKDNRSSQEIAEKQYVMRSYNRENGSLRLIDIIFHDGRTLQLEFNDSENLVYINNENKSIIEFNDRKKIRSAINVLDESYTWDTTIRNENLVIVGAGRYNIYRTEFDSVGKVISNKQEKVGNY